MWLLVTVKKQADSHMTSLFVPGGARGSAISKRLPAALSFLSPTRSKTQPDLESQEKAVSDEDVADKSHATACFLKLFLGLSDDEIRKYPSIHAYCQHVECLLSPLVSPAYEDVCQTVPSSLELTSRSCWPWVLAVVRALNNQDSKASIEDVWKHMLPRGGHNSKLGHSLHALAYLAIFGVLCSVTMTLRPVLDVNELQDPIGLSCEFIQPIPEEARHQRLDKCKRPISVLFRAFKESAWGIGPTSSDAGSDNLYESSLNYYSLSEFSKIRVRWVDSIADHLRFDPASRRLYLFQFPSLCVLKAIYGKNSCAFLQSIDEAFDPLSSGSVRTTDYDITLDQEIIISYRLLFGKSGRSRRLAQKCLADLKGEGDDRVFDDLLSALCGQKYRPRRYPWTIWRRDNDRTLEALPASVWPAACRDSDGNLQECDVYSVTNDFPRFGRRLADLQRFNLRQRPSRLTDFWRDRRNPLQWYTFWIVLLVGGAGIMLAVLQLVVGVMQLIKSW